EVVDCIARYQEELRGGTGDPVTFPDAPHPVLNVGTIRGGTASNTIAEECHVTVTYRWLPGQEPHAIHRAIAERLAELDGRDRGGSRGPAGGAARPPPPGGAPRPPPRRRPGRRPPAPLGG